MINERAVRILLECILVIRLFLLQGRGKLDYLGRQYIACHLSKQYFDSFEFILYRKERTIPRVKTGEISDYCFDDSFCNRRSITCDRFRNLVEFKFLRMLQG